MTGRAVGATTAAKPGGDWRMNRRTFLAATAGAGAAFAVQGVSPVAATRSSEIKILLWCWDARMTWDDEPGNIQTHMAAAEKRFPYPKKGESFQVGFRRLMDYCSAKGIWGIIIWGFLRDAHGGVAAARDLCLYARDRGVSILPGVGLCAYGGYYYEGSHPFNLECYLEKYPERAGVAREEGGGREVRGVLDPSLPENRQWWRDGLEWMMDTFAIGGINYEMGDFVVNISDRAQAARAELGIDTNENILDMVVATRDLMNAAYTWMPQGTFINALYRGYPEVKNLEDIPYAKIMHPMTVWEYTLTGMAGANNFDMGYARIPDHRKYGYLHWFNASTKTVGKDYVKDVARVFPKLHELKFEFAGTYGELRADSGISDRNYRAQVAWGRDPHVRMDAFE